MSVVRKILWTMIYSSARKTKQYRLILLWNWTAGGEKKTEVHKKSRTPLSSTQQFEVISLKWIKSLTNFC